MQRLFVLVAGAGGGVATVTVMAGAAGAVHVQAGVAISEGGAPCAVARAETFMTP